MPGGTKSIACIASAKKATTRQATGRHNSNRAHLMARALYDADRDRVSAYDAADTQPEHR
jgi:hypothetical protein